MAWHLKSEREQHQALLMSGTIPVFAEDGDNAIAFASGRNEHGQILKAHAVLERAALIAAAPELVEACRRVLQAIQWSVTADRMTPEDQATILRAALQKAGVS